MVLATRQALQLIEADLDRLVETLFALARAHAASPMLGRTLLQPAEVISFGAKVVAWLAPLVRARRRITVARDAALQLQLGGAVGTLGGLDERGPAVARGVGARLGLTVPAGAWHVQRDAWVALACEAALLCGSLGKIGRDLALLAQGEVGEVREPGGPGRGSSSAMPHKRNPVAALVAIAAATRAPQLVATLLATLPQEHERGLGNWQAELAQWPALFMATHGAVQALADAGAGLEIDGARMRANIDAHLRAVAAADAKAPPVDVDATARRASRLVESQLAALDPEWKGSPR
jgi:3-carboxy-cis,cis-muconate cycloisomerase